MTKRRTMNVVDREAAHDEPGNDVGAASAPSLSHLALLLLTDVEAISVRIASVAPAQSLALVLLRERNGGQTRYRGGVGQDDRAEVAVDLAVRHALLRGADPLRVALERWAEAPGIIAVAWRDETGVDRLTGTAAPRDQQDALLEMLDLPGVLDVDTAAAAHRVVHCPPLSIALAVELGHPVLGRLDGWLRSVAAEVGRE
jgi:hypothetical protein